MARISGRKLLAAAAYALACAGSAFADLAGVDHADDVCPPDADPCVIAERVATVDGAVLDFGSRRVEVTGDGGFDIGTGEVVVKCGSFSGTPAGGDPLVNGRGGADAGGDIDILARGSCADAPSQPCFEDSECTTGVCVGTAGATIAGRIELHGRQGGGVTIKAKDDIVVSQLIDVSGGLDGAGGVFIVSHTGSFTLDAPIIARSPGYGAFMYLTTDPVISDSRSVAARGAVSSSRGMTINAPIVAGAGEEGGEIYVISIADLKLNASIYASGHGTYEYGGYGGYITVIAEGGDLAVSRGVRLLADASMNAQDAGDGGLIEVRADGGNLVVPSGVKVRARGGGAYAYGGQVYFDAAGDAAVSARVDVSSRGTESSGGEVVFEADRDVAIGPEFRARARGVDDGGSIDIFAAHATIEGRFSLPVGGPGASGSFFASADQIALGARIELSGTASARYDAFELEACNVTLLDTADVENRVASGTNRVETRGTLSVAAGASLAAVGDGGLNRFVYRDSAQPPVVLGDVTPAPVLELNDTLAPCP